MEIIWRPRAIEGLEHARAYIARENPRTARRILSLILAAIARLPQTPDIGRPGRVPGTRELVIPRTPYRIRPASDALAW